MFQLSTGLRTYLLGAVGGFQSAMAGGLIKFYTGSPPASADAAPTGTLLSTISLASAGTGINLDDPSDGNIVKEPAEVWSGVNVASGTAGYFRYVAAGDTGALSTSEKRLQGTCGLSGADANFSNVNLVSGATQTVDSAAFTMPASA